MPWRMLARLPPPPAPHAGGQPRAPHPRRGGRCVAARRSASAARAINLFTARPLPWLSSSLTDGCGLSQVLLSGFMVDELRPSTDVFVPASSPEISPENRGAPPRSGQPGHRVRREGHLQCTAPLRPVAGRLTADEKEVFPS